MTERSNQESSGSAATDAKGQAPRSNRAVVVICAGFVVGMVGVSYAAVPLYDMFCKVTGYGGTTQRVEQASELILDRKITIRFDGNVAPGLAWEFGPDSREIEIRIGETVQADYTARNRASGPATGQATYNVTPQRAGAYFNKVECFCFTETTLAPGDTLEMPVVFFVDPAIVDDPETRNIDTITLSYTFFAHEEEKPVAAAVPPVQEKTSL